jgi:DNA helicase II / ATP-dependent DNA helicase PcrA
MSRIFWFMSRIFLGTLYHFDKKTNPDYSYLGMNYQTNFEENYRKLNEKQRLAVDTIDGPVLVIAGPGSGKTQLLALRVANILKQTDTDPRSILCLTFTDSAAQNMLERLVSFIGKDAYKVAIHTFHSFATEIINHNPECFFSGATYKPADSLAQFKILNDIFDNLEHDNPFKVWSEDHQYSYLKDAQTSISSVKKEGMIPEGFKKILDENAKFLESVKELVASFFIESVKTITPEKFEHFIVEFEEKAIKTDLTFYYLNSLKSAYSEVLTLQKRSQTKPITEWKKSFTKLNDQTGEIELKDQNQQKKHYALANLYQEYQEKLHEKGLFDFDDMLIEVNRALKSNLSLAYQYQEQFLYVLVDEFQDTNSSQSDLLFSIIDSEFAMGEPNILAVGDDDQAIYKFQGANLKNIINFTDRYPKSQVITLEVNYRSTQPILNLSKSVIEQTSTRLSTKLNIPKPLLSGIDDIKGNRPILKSFETRDQELLYISKKIQDLLENGVSPEEIAVLTRDHKQLVDVVKIFDHLKIPVRYDRGQNVLEQPLIRHIIHLLKFISSVNEPSIQEMDEFMPEILAFGVFDLNPQTVYKISHLAYKNRVNWLDVMANVEVYNSLSLNKNIELKLEAFDEREVAKMGDISRFLLDLVTASKNETAEQILDRILGVSEDQDSIPQDENDEGGERLPIQNKSYYFSFKDWLSNTPEYLSYLSGLKVFFATLRGYQPRETILLNDVLDLVEVIEQNSISMIDNSPYNQHEKAVQLMTSHKAKGLEFEHVFVIDVVQSVWAKRGKINKISLPLNLPYLPDKDDVDDHIRLFFVALTRAKTNLYLTSFEKNDKNSGVQLLEYIVGNNDLFGEYISEPHIDFYVEDKQNVLQTWLLGELSQRTLTLDQKEWLRPQLENYKLSVTHLNNFLDVVNGGPHLFLEQNLLRFPKSKSFSSAYGTAIHEAIAQFYRQFKGFGKMPEFEEMVQIFEITLKEQRLTAKQEENGINKGRDALREFYTQKKQDFDIRHDIELDFGHQNVRVGNAHITGKLDQIWYNDDKTEAIVVDLKTGKSADSWRGDDIMMQKLDRYRRQLVFYRLLVENSRDYSHLKVNQGGLLFVEPDKKDRNLVKTLMLDITNDDVNEIRNLVRIVWEKITNFDFPDTSGYEKTNKGVQQFIEDLLDND